ncbi:hypothetical protein Mal64_03430 [Pseudobythopirellula maris]|uniref:Uncharacterized protein n=1 Tax=Pseudobythopirellula maris TaxID=2527991 RepID=A0A5C5ZT40_9BACT|nr:DUF4175 domain-containing protein [Pseudobythopirellula maris]TWT89961.1 hypothetical protein Mal64_03430 [Pseudobythopirellula maris]
MPTKNAIQNVIDQTTVSLRRALWARLTMRVIAFVLALLWIGLLGDYFLEPSPTVRATIGAAVGLIGLGLLVRELRTAFRPLARDEIVLAIARRLGTSADAFVTAAELAEDPERSAAIQPALLRETDLAAQETLDHVGPLGIVRWRALGGKSALVAFVLLATVAIGLAFPGGAGVYLRRLGLAEEPWPRRVRLVAEGFEPTPDGPGQARKVARDSPFELAVVADLTGGHIAPRVVDLRYTTASGVKGRDSLARVGDPNESGAQALKFRRGFDSVTEDLTLWLRGGDCRLGPLRLLAVARPRVSELQADCVPPTYLGQRPFSASVASLPRLPEGTAVTLQGETSKPLESLTAVLLGAGGEPTPLIAQLDDSGVRFEIPLSILHQTATIELALLDRDGVASAEAMRVVIGVDRDEPPVVSLAFEGVGPAVTPEARITATASADDDHGVASMTLTLSGSQETVAKLPLAPPQSGDATVTTVIDLLTLRGAKQGQRASYAEGESLSIVATTSDHYDLGGKPHTAASTPRVFEVVSAAELLARLAEREIDLNRAFEETTRATERLALSLEQSLAPPAGAEGEANAEDGDAPGAAIRLRQRRLEAQKLRSETRAAAAAFAAIHDEVMNNRIDNSDLIDRLGRRIARPLERVAADQLSDVEKTLGSAAESPAGSGTRRTAIENAHNASRSALRQMLEVLTQMQSLETYNRVVADLRGIIQEQRDVQNSTEQSRKEGLRRLLLD